MVFFWEGNTGGITTPQQAARKRAISEAMLGQSRSGANNWGEGLARVAQALTGTVLEGRASEAERAGAEEVAALLAGLSPESGFGDISAALANPWLAESPGGSAIAQALLGENMRRSDPMYGLNLDAARMSNERAAMELDALRNPVADPWAGTQVINDQVVGMGEGGPQVLGDFRSADVTPLMQNLEAAGLVPGTPEYAQAIIDSVTRPQSQINIGGQQDPLWGDAPKDQVWLRDGAGNVITEPDASGRGVRPVSVPIVGSALDREAATLAGVEDAQISSNLDKAATTLATTRAVLDELDNAGGAFTTGTFSRPAAILSNTPAGRIRSYVGTLQSGVALGAMQRLKEASATGATGFGALNGRELDLLINDIGALDPDTTEPDIFRSTIERIDERARKVVADIQRNVSPERIAELGLEDLIAEYAPQSQANPEIFGGTQPTEIAPGITIRRLD